MWVLRGREADRIVVRVVEDHVDGSSSDEDEDEGDDEGEGEDEGKDESEDEGETEWRTSRASGENRSVDGADVDGGGGGGGGGVGVGVATRYDDDRVDDHDVPRVMEVVVGWERGPTCGRGTSGAALV